MNVLSFVFYLIQPLVFVRNCSSAEAQAEQVVVPQSATPAPFTKFKALSDRLTVEIILVQDFSSSYADDLDQISKQIPDLFNEIKSVFPESRFGIVGFTDKPVGDFGYQSAGDYCADVRQPLTTNISKIKKSLQVAIIRSGKDWAESQLHALLTAAKNPEINWYPDSVSPDGREVLRIALVLTDAGYHKAGDSSLRPNDGDGIELCAEEDYPSIDQVASALREQGVQPVFITPRETLPIYRKLVRAFGYWGTVYEGATDSSDVKTVAAIAIQELIDPLDCGPGGCTRGCVGSACGKSDTASPVLIKLAHVPKHLALRS